mmetsp:Transcript_10344/g.30374  ORF Transcript_10344/g.30374 Transcript_10344/m.30374 type:complete len:302 (+) Transcript_10344:1989-2894(+)
MHEAPGGRGEGHAARHDERPQQAARAVRGDRRRGDGPVAAQERGEDGRVLRRARGAARAPAHQGRARGLLRLRPVRPEVRGRPVARGELRGRARPRFGVRAPRVDEAGLLPERERVHEDPADAPGRETAGRHGARGARSVHRAGRARPRRAVLRSHVPLRVGDAPLRVRGVRLRHRGRGQGRAPERVGVALPRLRRPEHGVGPGDGELFGPTRRRGLVAVAGKALAVQAPDQERGPQSTGVAVLRVLRLPQRKRRPGAVRDGRLRPADDDAGVPLRARALHPEGDAGIPGLHLGGRQRHGL